MGLPRGKKLDDIFRYFYTVGYRTKADKLANIRNGPMDIIHYQYITVTEDRNIRQLRATSSQ